MLLLPSPPVTAAPALASGWMRRHHAAIEAASRDAAAPRVVVVGPAGSGKSTLLRVLHEALLDEGREAVLVTPGTPTAPLPTADVLIVDDLHLLGPDLIAAIASRAEDPDAGLVVAHRPWSPSEAATAIQRQLARSQPAIVLGHVVRSDVLDELSARGRTMPAACVERILHLTAGVSWLIAAALAAHDERDCIDDPEHRALVRLLDAEIGHRLDAADDDIRRLVERRCLLSPAADPSPPEESDAVALEAYAEGLLLRNGTPVPAVRSAVCGIATAHTIARLAGEAADGTAFALDSDVDDAGLSGRLRGPGVAAALVAHGDRLLDTQPDRARELYEAAWESGHESLHILVRRATAAWAAGDLDTAAVLAEAASARADDTAEDTAPISRPDRERLADLTAAIWAARGMFAQSLAAYRAIPPRSPDSLTRALVAAIGTGTREPTTDGAPATEAPSTLSTAMMLLNRGIRGTFAPGSSDAVLVDLVRSSEMYTAARTSAPIAELPAVITAVVALTLGDAATAQSVIDDALTGGHGGRWARPRLLLWRAWIAVQRVRPHEARSALRQAESEPGPRSPRDRLLAHAVDVALARRYGDAVELGDAWHRARAALLRIDIDAFLFLPLTELVSAAAKSGDAERATQLLARALEITEGLGSAPLWSAAVRWAGVQRSILLGHPDELIPHAHALVEAGRRDAVSHAMAKAGRVWTSVLAGTVDPDAVEEAALQLASFGMAWDAARLAGHGAARATDRRISARLLARARELHPIENDQKAPPASRADAAGGSGPSSTPPAADVLSEREREVARLVLQGKTYAEIGEAIFISPRTAEHHIAHIRRRLGANSRSEVITMLRLLMAEPAPDDEPGADPHPAA
ncbi:LuxR C-terminal-related transcriptional regulator [Microbacterium sp. NPDC058389]|uniref:LuxR C-terminal-related transcriptional regulator n=1 Tax=Microbacterium sp. NPDC058389 TaxID=3346475 RepID=UPI003667CB4D